MMRTGGSIQIKAKLFCGHLSSLLSQLTPLAFVQDQVENQLSLKSVFLVQRNLVTNICFSAIKIIRCVLLERELGVSWRAQKSRSSSESRSNIMIISSIMIIRVPLLGELRDWWGVQSSADRGGVRSTGSQKYKNTKEEKYNNIQVNTNMTDEIITAFIW